MTHRTQQVISAFATQVSDALTRSVYAGREFGVSDENLPATFVYLGPEEPGAEDEGATWPTLYPRLELIVVEGAAIAADIEDTLLAMRLDTTKALRADYTLGLSFVTDLIEGPVEQPEYEGEGNVRAFLRHHWFVQFQRDWDDPES